jgi:hypothetical protein
MNDRIVLTPFEQSLAAALRDELPSPTPECLGPEELLDLVEQAEKHPHNAAVQRHLAQCAPCRNEYALLRQTWLLARRLPAGVAGVTGRVAADAPQAPDDAALHARTAATGPLRPVPGATPDSVRPGASFLRAWLMGPTGGRARLAWAAACAALLVAGWSLWAGQQARTGLRAAKSELNSARMRAASAQDQLRLAREQAARAENERQLAGQEAQLSISRLLVEVAGLRHRQLVAANDDNTDELAALNSIAELRGPADATRGSDAVRLRRPRATCVLEQRPRFEWELESTSTAQLRYELTIEGADGYRAEVALPRDASDWDMAGAKSAAVPSLKRGAVYQWRVRAIATDAPPIASSWARFKVVSQATAVRLHQIRRDSRDRPLVLFRAYLHDGLLDDARDVANTMLDKFKSPAPVSGR